MCRNMSSQQEIMASAFSVTNNMTKANIPVTQCVTAVITQSHHNTPSITDPLVL